MDLLQLRCFVLATEELHFGRAAQRLGMLPSAFGRHIQLLEEDLGAKLFLRTTRSVALTDEGHQLLRDAKQIVSRVDTVRTQFKKSMRSKSTKLRVGAIDSAAIGLLPSLINDFRAVRPDVEVDLVEDKTIRLLPRVVSGRLDLAFVRLPQGRDTRLTSRHLMFETPILAIPSDHPLAARERLSIPDIVGQPLIVPDRRSRPHSHDMTIKLFEAAGLEARVSQVADEKQTIVNLVAAKVGMAIVPRWISRMTLAGVTYVPLSLGDAVAVGRLPLSAVWARGTRDALREEFLGVLMDKMRGYAAGA